MDDKYWIQLGAVLAALAVAAGAMGAHLLEQRLEAAQLKSFETAARYQMVHALALILTGILLRSGPSGWLQAAAIAFSLGIVLFSGGLYAWLYTGSKPFVHIVPLGGGLWIVAWLLLAVGAGRAAHHTLGP